MPTIFSLGENHIIESSFSSAQYAEIAENLGFFFTEANRCAENSQQVICIEFSNQAKMDFLVIHQHHEACQIVSKNFPLKSAESLNCTCILQPLCSATLLPPFYHPNSLSKAAEERPSKNNFLTRIYSSNVL